MELSRSDLIDKFWERYAVLIEQYVIEERDGFSAPGLRLYALDLFDATIRSFGEEGDAWM